MTSLLKAYGILRVKGHSLSEDELAAEWEAIEKVRSAVERPLAQKVARMFAEQSEAARDRLPEILREIDPSAKANPFLEATMSRIIELFWDTWIQEATSEEGAVILEAGFRTGSLRIDVEVTDYNASPLSIDVLRAVIGKTRGVNQTTKEMLAEIVYRELAAGRSIDEVTQAVLAEMDDWQAWRAHTVAQTAATGVFETGQMDAYRLAGINEHGWLSQRDARVRRSHMLVDGEVVALGEVFSNGLQFPGDPNAQDPSEVIGCFVGDTPVSGSVRKAFRHEFDGKTVTLETTNGHRLTGTANHPILTPSGFVPMGLLNVGDDLVCSRNGNRSSAGVDVENRPPGIEQVFNALSDAGDGMRVGRGVVNLYGHRPTTDVDVVDISGLLLDGGEPNRLQVIRNRLLLCSLLRSGLLFRQRLFSAQLAEVLRRQGSHLRIRGGHDLPTAILSKLLHSDPVLFRGRSQDSTTKDPTDYRPRDAERLRQGLDRLPVLVSVDDLPAGHDYSFRPHGDAARLQPTANSIDRATQIIRQCRDGFTGQVSLDQVVRVDVQTAHGLPVFTMETEHGVYSAGGVVVSNCRCSTLPKLPTKAFADLSGMNDRELERVRVSLRDRDIRAAYDRAPEHQKSDVIPELADRYHVSESTVKRAIWGR